MVTYYSSTTDESGDRDAYLAQLLQVEEVERRAIDLHWVDEPDLVDENQFPHLGRHVGPVAVVEGVVYLVKLRQARSIRGLVRSYY